MTTQLFCLVAGYIGSPKQWNLFGREWRRVLRKYRIDVFHGRVFFNRDRISDPKRNPYFGWSDEKATRFINDLLSTIRVRQIRPVGSAIDVSAFESFSYGERCLLVGYHPVKSRRKHRVRPAPYHFGVRILVEDSLRAARPDTEIQFILAEQKNLQQRALEGYQLLKTLWPESSDPSSVQNVKRLKELGFESPKGLPGLQAADLFANRWYNTLVHAGHVSRENANIMDQLTRDRNSMSVADVPGIERIFDAVGITMAERQQLRAVEEPS